MKAVMIAAALALGTSLSAVPLQAQPTRPAERTPDVIFVPTPQEVVDAMLVLGKVKDGDVLYDLGSGDGRIPITAAKKFKVKATGIDIDPVRIQEARANATAAGVNSEVTFKQEDLFKTNFADATVITLYLLPELNVKLRPRLLAELKPGTRIVSHAFRMGDWEPEVTQDVNGRTIYLWTVPAAQLRRGYRLARRPAPGEERCVATRSAPAAAGSRVDR